MRVAKYWAEDVARATLSDGSDLRITIRRGSDMSHDDARAIAAQAAAEMSEEIRLSDGPPDEYVYSMHSRCEPIIEDYFEGLDRIGAITINRLRCHVLNTARLAFIDVDLPTKRKPRSVSGSRPGLLSRLFGKPQEPQASENDSDDPWSGLDQQEHAAVEKLREWIGSNPEHAARVYRTTGGLRFMLPNVPMDPTAESTHRMFRQTGADHLYGVLCRHQESFRARLTAKPWRMPEWEAQWEFREKWPTDQDDEDERELYENMAAGYAACHHVGDIGTFQYPDARTRELVEVHDERSGAFTDLPLA